MDPYTLHETPPTIEEYQRLREAVGWHPVDPTSAAGIIANTLYWVTARSGDRVIGCGRVIGDGAVYFYIQDVVVLPEFQRRGVGTAMMGAIMRYLQNHVREGAFVGLLAAKDAAPFYERFGFEVRPPDRPGMSRQWATRQGG